MMILPFFTGFPLMPYFAHLVPIVVPLPEPRTRAGAFSGEVSSEVFTLALLQLLVALLLLLLLGDDDDDGGK